ncbi:CWF19-like protein 2 isoform X1 [Electrophorus electricus]|uniref:CWF19-like protein 2 n=1 Tax=Electrophorus electricus TaxID=8005 RepID=A0A4W4DUV7_ELEEL|nr:CWF19-like protein 2 isoform X1 [Electrophorus electricus]
MAAYGGSFESANNIEARKEFKRKAREEILQKAKKKYEDEEKKNAERKARGEDTWMLPEVDQRLQQMGQEHSVKSKRKKKKEKSEKKKKEKKKKVRKEKRRSQEDASSDSSQDSEEWVEATPQTGGVDKAWKVSEQTTATASSTNSIQRDEWMTFDFLAMKTTSVAERRAQKEVEKEAEREREQTIQQAGLHRLELNPYWKDGGSGLPPEENASTTTKKAAVVDDGGLSWLRKSYQRMKEQAEREKCSLDAVVAERYGSMELFQKRLREAEAAAITQTRRDREQERERGRRGEGDERRERGRREANRATELSRQRDSERDQDRDRPRDGYRDRERERWPHADQRGREGNREARASRDGLARLPGAEPQPQRVHTQRDPARDLATLEGRFLKPSDTDDDLRPVAGWRKAGETTLSSGPSLGRFLKPGDEEDDTPAWRKSGCRRGLGRQEENESRKETSEQPAPAPQQSAALRDKSSSESEEDDGEEEVEVPLLTDEEMNKLGAKLVKAELMGNVALVSSLKAQLEGARKAREVQRHAARPVSQASAQEQAEQEVVLFRTDHSGRAWPVSGPSQHLEPRGGRRKKKAIETHEAGERVRYFEDDDGMDLREMVRREKMSSAQDQNALYSRMAARMMGKQDGENYTLDDMFVSSAAQRERAGLDEARQRSRAMEEARRLAGQMDKCPYCFSSSELPKHLVVAIGAKVYLCLPNSVSLTEGHCLIAPLHHHCCSTGLDEDVWNEIQLFRRALVRMFQAQDQDCVFLEMHTNPKRRMHMLYECVPLPRELGDMAPIYFKKAIMEADEEWAMNQKLVDLSSKNIRQAVPQGLPFFSVNFGLQGGFAHVIENEHKFPPYFGKEVLGGMLDLEPRRWRKPIRENFDDQRKKVLQFSQWWKPFDCTKPDS